MRPTKEWVERLEASGATWGLFVSISHSAFTNYVLTGKDFVINGKKITVMSQITKSLWTLRGVALDEAGHAILTHYEHRQPRSGEKSYVFAREFPPIIKYSCKADKFLHDTKSWKRFRDLLNQIDCKGIWVCQLLVGEQGYAKHSLNIGFENENDAILFQTLTEKSLTNTR